MPNQSQNALGYTVEGTFNNIGASQTGANLVAGVTGRVIRVHEFIVGAGTVTGYTFVSKNGTGTADSGTAITGSLFAPIGVSGASYEEPGHFDTGKGSTLAVTTASGGSVGFTLKFSYVE